MLVKELSVIYIKPKPQNKVNEIRGYLKNIILC